MPGLTPSLGVRGREPVERFRPTTGAVAGWSGLVVAAIVIGWTIYDEHTVLGARVIAASLVAAVLVWITQLRPRITAYEDALLMRGMVRDSLVPYIVIDEVVMGQTLVVWAGGRRYVCVGIGRTRRAELRARGQTYRGGGAGRGRTPFGQPQVSTTPHEVAYPQFVLDRITGLVAVAHEHPLEGDPPPVRSRLALPELVALALTAAVFLVTLLL